MNPNCTPQIVTLSQIVTFFFEIFLFSQSVTLFYEIFLFATKDAKNEMVPKFGTPK